MESDLQKAAALWDEVLAAGTYRLEIPDELVVGAMSMFRREGVKKILDIGCGLGRHIQMFVERGYPVLGMDISMSAIKKSRVLVAHYPLAHLAYSDVTALPVRSDELCLALAWRMLHLNTQAQIELAIGEIHRVLRPNGIVMCSVRSDSNTLFFKAKKNGQEIEPNTFIMESNGLKGLLYHFFTRDEVEKTFSKYFRILSIEERELEHTGYTSGGETGRNWFWIITGRKKSD